jgi:hypothetical protein
LVVAEKQFGSIKLLSSKDERPEAFKSKIFAITPESLRPSGTPFAPQIGEQIQNNFILFPVRLGLRRGRTVDASQEDHH